MYNGRYSGDKDFLALQIVNGQVEFSVSLGSLAGQKEIVHTVKSFIPGGINDGDWHVVKAKYNNKVCMVRNNAEKSL